MVKFPKLKGKARLPKPIKGLKKKFWKKYDDRQLPNEGNVPHESIQGEDESLLLTKIAEFDIKDNDNSREQSPTVTNSERYSQKSLIGDSQGRKVKISVTTTEPVDSSPATSNHSREASIESIESEIEETSPPRKSRASLRGMFGCGNQPPQLQTVPTQEDQSVDSAKLEEQASEANPTRDCVSIKADEKLSSTDNVDDKAERDVDHYSKRGPRSVPIEVTLSSDVQDLLSSSKSRGSEDTDTLSPDSLTPSYSEPAFVRPPSFMKKQSFSSSEVDASAETSSEIGAISSSRIVDAINQSAQESFAHDFPLGTRYTTEPSVDFSEISSVEASVEGSERVKVAECVFDSKDVVTFVVQGDEDASEDVLEVIGAACSTNQSDAATLSLEAGDADGVVKVAECVFDSSDVTTFVVNGDELEPGPDLEVVGVAEDPKETDDEVDDGEPIESASHRQKQMKGKFSRLGLGFPLVRKRGSGRLSPSNADTTTSTIDTSADLTPMCLGMVSENIDTTEEGMEVYLPEEEDQDHQDVDDEQSEASSSASVDDELLQTAMQFAKEYPGLVESLMLAKTVSEGYSDAMSCNPSLIETGLDQDYSCTFEDDVSAFSELEN